VRNRDALENNIVARPVVLSFRALLFNLYLS
jgi:hypothetical protein